MLKVASGADDPGAFTEDFCRWQEIPQIEQLARHSRVPAVDPVPEGGSLELAAGTHRGSWLMPRTFLTKEARWFPEGTLAELPDIDADPAAFDIRRFALQPGDAVFFDFLTVHGAPGFLYRSRRRILSLRYLAADARHAPRPWRTSPPSDGLQAELPPGATMDHPLFPLVQPLSPLRTTSFL